jgi:hypothetical protein
MADENPDPAKLPSDKNLKDLIKNADDSKSRRERLERERKERERKDALEKLEGKK